MGRTINVIMVDISGRVDIYDDALMSSLRELSYDNNCKLLRPRNGLLSLIPSRYKTSTGLLKRLVKVFEAILNYMYLVILLSIKRINVLHFQWLPFLEVNAWEILVLKIIKKMNSRIKIILTIHNIYPHNMNTSSKKAYNKRFRKACLMIDEFIVHTEISKIDVIREFDIAPNRLNVCRHGVFVPKGVELRKTNRKDGIFHVLQFGGQSYYKGTDLLVDAVSGLDDELQNKVEARIVGGISEQFLSVLKERDKNSKIIWKPYYLDDVELYEEINNSDLIVLPYRDISQSGVLLLAIYFEKLIICSDLPSFIETMHGGMGDDIDTSLFFRSDDSSSLRELITKYIVNEINEPLVKERITRLKTLYSWKSAAEATIKVYNKCNVYI